MIINEKLKKELFNLEDNINLLTTNDRLTDTQLENFLKGFEKIRYNLLSEIKLYNQTKEFEYERIKTLDEDYQAEYRNNMLKIYLGSNYYSSLSNSVFTQLYNVKEFSFHPNIVFTATNPINNCNALKSLILPKATNFGTSAFVNCVNLKYFVPVVTQITFTANSVLSGLYTIEEAPFLESVTSYTVTNAFPYNAYNLKKANFERLTSLGTSTSSTIFASCYSLEEIRFGKKISIPNSVGLFNGCYSLKRIILDGSTMSTLTGISPFTREALDPEMKIYVPDDLYNTYLANTYWSQIAYRIRKKSELNS